MPKAGDIKGLADDFRNKVLRDAKTRHLSVLQYISNQACDYPAGVTQDYLDSITLPSQDEVPEVPLLARIPRCPEALFNDISRLIHDGKIPPPSHLSARWLKDRAERLIFDDTLNTPPPPPTEASPFVPPPQPVLGSVVWLNLAGVADMACEHPENLTKEWLNGRLQGFPNGDASHGLGKTPAGCFKDLFAMLMEKNVNGKRGDKLDYDWLIQTAAGLKSPGGGSYSDPGQSNVPHRGSPPGNGPVVRPPDFRGR